MSRDLCDSDTLRRHSMLPFWFWNDAITEAGIAEQIADFVEHGIHGFVLHPRIGLPRELSWMSSQLLDLMEFAVELASRCGMRVLLYDEGMYPSGSCAGAIVEMRPDLACRGLACLDMADGGSPLLPDTHHLVARLTTRAGQTVGVIDRPVDSYIRGLHYIGEGPDGEEPPMADLLNPETAALFLKLTHERFFARLGKHFGNTIIGIFSDEPNPLGKCRERDLVRPGTTGIVPHVSRLLGYDFTPHLPALWYDDEPNAKQHKQDYLLAIRRRLAETWYAPLSNWCNEHGIALCGHPARGDEIGALRFFQIPGQDLVNRRVEMDQPSAVNGKESPQAKATSSTMSHFKRRFNSSEFGGGYGHRTTFEEIRWLAWWCISRGVNLLIPHAFFYSTRGYRLQDSPPPIGPHNSYWSDFKPFADAAARLCWVNTDSRQVCDVAILAQRDRCLWAAARACLQHQIDFNYLDAEIMEAGATISDEGIAVGDAFYRVLIVEGSLPESLTERLRPLAGSGRVVSWTKEKPGIAALRTLIKPELSFSSAVPGLRVRHQIKNANQYYILFNEGATPIDVGMTTRETARWEWIDLATGQSEPASYPLRVAIPSHEIRLARVSAGS
jgi:hypothetical protein